MKKNIPLALVVILVMCCVTHADSASYRDLYADTWVATDALDRRC